MVAGCRTTPEAKLDGVVEGWYAWAEEESLDAMGPMSMVEKWDMEREQDDVEEIEEVQVHCLGS